MKDERECAGRCRPGRRRANAMNRLCGFLLPLAATVLLGAPAALAGEPLPAPQQAGGMSLFEALKKRSSASGGDFSPAEITREELSTLLWAASGLNRGEKGWTVPLWRGVPPYCRVYVAADDGVFLYDWKNHGLEKVSDENIKGRIGKQAFVKKAYYTLIFVSDEEILSQFENEDITRDFGHVAVGAMTQNVYLASAALRIGARYVHSMNTEEISRALKLPQGDIPIALMLLGK
jgi:nitroreductase